MGEPICLQEVIGEDDMPENEEAPNKNTLKEYIEELRDSIRLRLGDYISTKDKLTLESKINDVEKWILQEEENKSAEVYKNKLEELRFYVQPANKRMWEHDDRKVFIDELNYLVNSTENFVQLYLHSKKRTGTYAERLVKVKIWLHEKENWLQEIITSLSEIELYEDPPVMAVEIQQEIAYFENSIRPFMNRLNTIICKPEKVNDKKIEPPKTRRKSFLNNLWSIFSTPFRVLRRFIYVDHSLRDVTDKEKSFYLHYPIIYPLSKLHIPADCCVDFVNHSLTKCGIENNKPDESSEKGSPVARETIIVFVEKRNKKPFTLIRGVKVRSDKESIIKGLKKEKQLVCSIEFHRHFGQVLEVEGYLPVEIAHFLVKNKFGVLFN